MTSINRAYHQTGNSFWPTDNTFLCEKLPQGTYSVNFSEKQQLYYLERQPDFTNPTKLYGDTITRAARIFSTYVQKAGSTGVLLTGKKGSGKTLLAKQLSELTAKQAGVTILVNQPFHGEQFNTFIASINQPALVIFDEFEKVYAKKAHQASLLTLFDGTYSGKKLYVVTCNDRTLLDPNLVNRPGRLHYALHFGGLTAQFMQEYCEDKLENKNNIAGVIEFSRQFGDFSFDMLQALVGEMNMYDETASQAACMLNLNPAQDVDTSYGLELLNALGEVYRTGTVHPYSIGNPLGLVGKSIIAYGLDDEDEDDDGAEGPVLKKTFKTTLSKQNLVSVSANGVFLFSTENPNITLRFKPNLGESSTRRTSYDDNDDDY